MLLAFVTMVAGKALWQEGVRAQAAHIIASRKQKEREGACSDRLKWVKTSLTQSLIRCLLLLTEAQSLGSWILYLPTCLSSYTSLPRFLIVFCLCLPSTSRAMASPPLSPVCHGHTPVNPIIQALVNKAWSHSASGLLLFLHFRSISWHRVCL